MFMSIHLRCLLSENGYTVLDVKVERQITIPVDKLLYKFNPQLYVVNDNI